MGRGTLDLLGPVGFVGFVGFVGLGLCVHEDDHGLLRKERGEGALRGRNRDLYLRELEPEIELDQRLGSLRRAAGCAVVAAAADHLLLEHESHLEVVYEPVRLRAARLQRDLLVEMTLEIGRGRRDEDGRLLERDT